MSEIMFVVLLFFFFTYLFRRSIWKYVTDIMKICRDNTISNCSCAGKVSEKESKEKHHENPCVEKASELDDFRVLGKMGYYLASNDERNTQTYAATPLQDLDPKDLA